MLFDSVANLLSEQRSLIGTLRLTDGDFSAVDIEPVRELARPVTLSEMRADAALGKMMMFRRQRLSVVPLTKDEFDEIVALGGKGRKVAAAR